MRKYDRISHKALSTEDLNCRKLKYAQTRGKQKPLPSLLLPLELFLIFRKFAEKVLLHSSPGRQVMARGWAYSERCCSWVSLLWQFCWVCQPLSASWGSSWWSCGGGCALSGDRCAWSGARTRDRRTSSPPCAFCGAVTVHPSGQTSCHSRPSCSWKVFLLQDIKEAYVTFEKLCCSFIKELT